MKQKHLERQYQAMLLKLKLTHKEGPVVNSNSAIVCLRQSMFGIKWIIKIILYFYLVRIIGFIILIYLLILTGERYHKQNELPLNPPPASFLN